MTEVRIALVMTAPVRGIAGLDRLADELAAACPPRLGIADSPADLLAAHRLRSRDGVDVFDARSLQVCAWDGDTLVGTLRLALPMPGKRLPVEEEFDLTVASEGEVVDVGPPLVAADGEQAQRIADGLLAQAWFETRARGYLVMAGVASSRLVGHYRALGLAVEELGRAEADRNAVRLDPSLS